MDIKQIIQSQYLAALAMLKEAVAACPPESWNDPQDRNKFWHSAYHALFYVHLYLQDTEHTFTPWAKHHQEYQYMGQVPGPLREPPRIGEPYSREEVLEFHEFVCAQVRERVPALDLEAPSGFHWLPFGKLEQQIYSIRHLQQHTGELYERLGARAAIDLKWVGDIPCA